MGVRVDQRGLSQAQYCYNCYKIYSKANDFMSRFSYRYYFLTSGLSTTLSLMLTYARTADGMYQKKSPESKLIRKQSLLQLYGALESLDSQFTYIVKTLLESPQDVFTTINGAKVSKSDALRKIDNMSDELGCLIYDTKELVLSLVGGDAINLNDDNN